MLALVGCARHEAFVPPQRPDQIVDFDWLFTRNCQGCHGKNGQFGPAPPLNDSLFLAIIPDAELRQVIVKGRKGTPMPAFARSQGGPLTDAQVEALVTGLRQRWQPAQPPAKGKLPAYLGKPGDKDRGATVFAETCANCHGDDGKDGEKGSVNEPAFLALASDQLLRRIIITGRQDFKMPDYAHHLPDRPLTEQEIADLVALLASWRQPQ